MIDGRCGAVGAFGDREHARDGGNAEQADDHDTAGCGSDQRMHAARLKFVIHVVFLHRAVVANPILRADRHGRLRMRKVSVMAGAASVSFCNAM